VRRRVAVDTGNPIRSLNACAYETCSLILLTDFANPVFVILLLVYGSLPFSPYTCTLILSATYRTVGGNPRTSPTTWPFLTEPQNGLHCVFGIVCFGSPWRDSGKVGAAALLIVKPKSVIKWQRQGFRLYWRWKSKASHPGRPRIDAEIRNLNGKSRSALIRRPAFDLFWGPFRLPDSTASSAIGYTTAS